MTTTIATLPAQLRPLAAAWARRMPDTQRDRQAAVRVLDDRAGLSLTAAREACEDAAVYGRAARTTRTTRRIAARLNISHAGTQLARQPVTGSRGRAAVKLPAGTPAKRLDALRRDAVLTTYRNAYRVPGSDHGDEYVTLTTDPAAVGVRQSQETTRDLYRGAYKGWSATITNTTITVPTDWRLRVQRAGLAVVDGLMTLDAGRLEGAPAGVDLFAAVWLVQGRGYTVTPARGYIARQGATAYHGDTPEKALAGLRRKLAGAEWAATVAAANLSDLLGRLPDADLDRATVRVSDARATGACEYGIRSWCHATGLPYDAGQATLRQVWQAYLTQPRTEARAAILHALRRQRRLAA